MNLGNLRTIQPPPELFSSGLLSRKLHFKAYEPKFSLLALYIE